MTGFFSWLFRKDWFMVVMKRRGEKKKRGGGRKGMWL